MVRRDYSHISVLEIILVAYNKFTTTRICDNILSSGIAAQPWSL